MTRALALLLLLTSLAYGQTLSYSKKTLTNNKKGQWTAKVVYPVFNGSTPLVKLANQEFSKVAKSGLDSFIKDAKEFRSEDARNQSEIPEYYYESWINVEVSRPNLIGAFYSFENFLGGAHGMHWYDPINIGVVGGKPKILKLQDLFRKGVNARATVSPIVIAKLKKTGRADWVNDGEIKGLSVQHAESFVITRKGLMFLYEPYAMGSYASGPFDVLVTWSELKGKIDMSGVLKGL